MKTLKLSAPLLLILLSGCKATVETGIKLSDLLSAETKNIVGDIYLEVPACSSYEDSRLESNSLIKAKATIDRVFEGTKYIECYQKQFKSYAHFSIPMKLDKEDDGKLASETSINIVSNDKTLLGVVVPKQLSDRINNIKKESFGLDSIEISLEINVIVDKEEGLKFHAYSAFVDGVPYLYEALEATNGTKINTKLSDVSVGQAMLGKMAFVMTKIE